MFLFAFVFASAFGCLCSWRQLYKKQASQPAPHSFALFRLCALSLCLTPLALPLSRSLCLCLSLSRCDGLGVCFSSNNKLLKNLCTRVFGVVRCTNNNNNNSSKHVSPANVVVALYDFYLLRFSCFCAKFFSFLSPRLVSSRLKLFSSLFFAR